MTPSTTRIEAFGDSVMAFIITIIVLELKVLQLAKVPSISFGHRE